ncbi:MAG: SDR family oxidoreductase [Thaumarchaeota archaeon]|nr:SDR family oxidoreductase [Nitrososphaerota archaeon]
MYGHFDGKIAFVTGAGAGIGRAIALVLAEEGAKIMVTDLNPEWAEKTAREIIGGGGKASSAKLDVTSKADVDSVIDSCWEKQGPIHFLINNAGVSTMNHVWDLTERDWDYNMNVNAKGVFLVTVSALRKMLHHEYGSEKPKIVNTASMAGKMPALYLAHYTASKFAVVGFTKETAVELAPFGINVNCVCPGYVKTGMQERELEWEAKLSNKTVEQVRASYVSQVPLGRLCEPEDVAKIVAFLCSHEADYMTGQALNVTGGQLMF